MSRSASSVWICAALALGTVAVFEPVRNAGFVWDDHQYLTQNPALRDGLTLESLRWALSSSWASNWHPLTWISHALDVSVFGLEPSGHHMVSLGLHVAAALALFFALRAATGSVGAAAFAAAAFAWHPLHVESVAWVAERKDVLSGLCFALALWAWSAWVRQASRPAYAAALVAFTAGLLAKPMLVTFPCLLILLDVWPFGRGLRLRRLPEKLPFFGLAAVSCGLTLWAQSAGGAVAGLEHVTVLERGVNALYAADAYLGRTLWPSGIAAFHPRLDRVPLGVIAIAAGTLGALTLFALAWARERPYLIVGWLWFLGMLVPVSGLVQVGSQAYASRYTYLPAIGLYVAAAFAARDLVAWREALRAPVGAALIVLLALWAGLARVEVGYWRDAESLFSRALEVTGDNWLAHTNLGLALYERGEHERAIPHLAAAVRATPDLYPAVLALGTSYAERGDYPRAFPLLARAVQLAPPEDRMPRRNLAELLVRLGQTQSAIVVLEEHLVLHPDDARSRARLAELREGRAP